MPLRDSLKNIGGIFLGRGFTVPQTFASAFVNELSSSFFYMSFAEDWNSSYLPSANKTKRRILLFTKEEQKKINEARKMRGLPDLSAMMAAQLGLPSAELLIPSSEMAATDATDASLQRRDSSPGAATATSKKKSKKRSHADPSIVDDPETRSEGNDRSESVEPSMKKRKKKKQRSLEKNAANRSTQVAHSSAQAGSIAGPPLNLALIDEPRNDQTPGSFGCCSAEPWGVGSWFVDWWCSDR